MRSLAPPKINLTLEIVGRRVDGYHELRSLVAFGHDCGDWLDLDPEKPFSLTISGPFASRIAGPNTIVQARSALLAIDSRFKFGAVRLEKMLPVASGIGGGSADAAAFMRMIAEVNPDLAPQLDWPTIASGIGADVPVCFLSKAAFMTGTGGTLHSIGPLPDLAAILVTPLQDTTADKTARVFKQLRAEALPPDYRPEPSPKLPTDLTALLGYIAQRGNDLLKPATELFPSIHPVLTEISAATGCMLASLSGAGPTCFGIFTSLDLAKETAERLHRNHVDWWVATTRLA